MKTLIPLLAVIAMLMPVGAEAYNEERMIWRVANRAPLCGQFLEGVNVKFLGRHVLGTAYQKAIMIAPRQERSELIYTVVHECGHVVDLNIGGDERFDIFGKGDYVTEYASIDPAEDYAESYTWFVLHRRQFRLMIRDLRSDSLRDKYLYFRSLLLRV